MYVYCILDSICAYRICVICRFFALPYMCQQIESSFFVFFLFCHTKHFAVELVVFQRQDTNSIEKMRMVNALKLTIVIIYIQPYTVAEILVSFYRYMFYMLYNIIFCRLDFIDIRINSKYCELSLHTKALYGLVWVVQSV